MRAIICLTMLALSSQAQAGTRHVVALDIGHTPAHPGAISATGIPEYEFNREVVKATEAALASTGTINPIVVTSPKILTLIERTRVAAANNAELFIAVHHDSVQDKYLRNWEVDGQIQRYCDMFSGYSVFYSEKNREPENSLYFAKLIGDQMVAHGFKFSRHHAETIRGENRRIIDDKAGVYRFDDLIVLKTAAMPAALLECGIIVNRQEEQSLLTSERRKKIADAVTVAVQKYFAAPRPASSLDIQKRPQRLEPIPRTVEPAKTPQRTDVKPATSVDEGEQEH